MAKIICFFGCICTFSLSLDVFFSNILRGSLGVAPSGSVSFPGRLPLRRGGTDDFLFDCIVCLGLFQAFLLLLYSKINYYLNFIQGENKRFECTMSLFKVFGVLRDFFLKSP